jgi:hypothetical protein
MIGQFQALRVDRQRACAAYPPVYMLDAGITLKRTAEALKRRYGRIILS